MSNNQDLHDERISRLYKLGEQPAPPEHLNTEIKRAARAAVPTKKRSYAWPSLATAAVLVLSISLVLKVLQQEPLKEPISTNGQAVPSATLQEKEEQAVPIKDEEAPKLQRYRAIKRKSVPAPAKVKTEKAIQLEAAPAMVGDIKPSQVEPMECNGITLPDSDSGEEWVKLHQKAMESGQLEMAKCLQQAYRSRFNRDMPMTSE